MLFILLSDRKTTRSVATSTLSGLRCTISQANNNRNGLNLTLPRRIEYKPRFGARSMCTWLMNLFPKLAGSTATTNKEKQTAGGTQGKTG